MNSIKKEGIEFNFVRARELSLHPEILDFKNRVMVAGIPLYKIEGMPLLGLTEILEEAILLDGRRAYRFKRRR